MAGSLKSFVRRLRPGKLKKFADRFRRWPSPARILIGILLLLFGILGFLPVVGYWMIPLGLLVLSLDFLWARRAYVTLLVWWRNCKRHWKAKRA